WRAPPPGSTRTAPRSTGLRWPPAFRRGRNRMSEETSLFLLFAPDVLGVLGGRHQILDLRVGGQLQLDEPAVPEGIVVDDSGFGHGRLVDFDDLARDRRIELGDRLDRLDGAELAVGVVHVSDLRELEVDDLSQLLLRVLGDADGSDLTVHPDPFVALRV